MLIVVPTPIGNLKDITRRAVQFLKNADYIAAEDTRHVQILLQRYEIKKPCVSFHGHSSETQIAKIILLLQEGKEVALVSDAGTPGISDPGYRLVRAAIEAGIKLTCLPGPTAFLPAITASGFSIKKFVYLGFLPIKKGRQTLLHALKNETRTVVFYESVHRIIKTIHQMAEIMGQNRRVVLARELTKLHETIDRGTLGNLRIALGKKSPRGEYVVVLEGAKVAPNGRSQYS